MKSTYEGEWRSGGCIYLLTCLLVLLSSLSFEVNSYTKQTLTTMPIPMKPLRVHKSEGTLPTISILSTKTGDEAVRSNGMPFYRSKST